MFMPVQGESCSGFLLLCAVFFGIRAYICIKSERNCEIYTNVLSYLTAKPSKLQMIVYKYNI